MGYQAGFSNTTGDENVYVGTQAGYSGTTAADNTIIGKSAGYLLTTGIYNTFVGRNSGQAITTGSKNTIIGAYDGNQDGLDIRVANNFIVLSDGDGNRLVTTSPTQTVALQGAVPNGGTGITFPATQVASADANTLDDYEEGSFTPSYVSTGATWTTYFEQIGRYTKIGNLVSIAGRIRSNANATGTLTNNVVITGLPFTSMNTLGTETALAVGLQTFSTTISPSINYGTTQIVMYKSNTADQFIASDTNGTRFFMFSASYRVGD